MSTAKRHHYVAQSYLRGFSPKGRASHVWVYEKYPNHQPKLKSTKSVAYSDFYYAQPDENGNDQTDILERAFGEIEKEFIENIRLILRNSHKKVNLDSEQRSLLAFFVAVSLTRVPSFREPAKYLYELMAQDTLKNQIDIQKIQGSLPSAIEKLWKEDKIKITVHEWITLKHMIQSALTISNSMLSKTWQFFKPDGNSEFITSDNPTIFTTNKNVGPHSIGPAHPWAELLFPLQKNFMLCCTPLLEHSKSWRKYSDCLVFEVNSETVRKINSDFAKRARKFVFAPFKSDCLRDTVQQHIGEEQTIKFG